MATDFNYNDKTINAGGPIKPSGKDMPSDPRTRVETYADISTIPTPYVGMKITVKADENNDGAMVDYIVKSLKANSLGVANTLIDEVVPYADYLGVSAGSGSGTGLTTEQAQQLQTAYQHSQTVHVQASDIPSLEGYATETFVTNNYASKNHNHSEYASSSHRHDASEIDNLPSGSGNTSTIEIINDLTTGGTDKALSAEQGKILKNEVNTVISDYLGNKKLIYLTQAEYNSLTEEEKKDESVVYNITDAKESDSDNYSLSYTNNILSLNKNESAISSVAIEGGTGSPSNISRLVNKKWLVIGDSITLESSSHTTKNYSKFISERTGCILSNHGRDGYTVARYIEENLVEAMPSDVDLVTVLLGTNDWHIGELPLGNVLDTNTTTVAGCYNLLIQQLIQKYGDRTLLVFTPLQRKGYGGDQSGLKASNNSYGFNLLALVDIIKKTCENYGIPCKDLYRESGFHLQYDISNSLYFTDGLHPNILGHEALSYIMQPFIENNYIPHVSVTFGNLIISKESTTINEGGTDTFTVSLDASPSIKQNVKITTNNSDVTVNPSNLSFDSSNYSEPQTIRITVAEDDSDYSNENCTITISSNSVTSKTITVSITDNDTAPESVSVTGVSLNYSEHTLKQGQKLQLEPTIEPSNATNKTVTWSANNNNVTVSNNGLVTGVNVGESIVTVTTEDGNYSKTCTITVEEAVVNYYDLTLDGYGSYSVDNDLKTSTLSDNNTSWNSVACSSVNLVAGNSYTLEIEIIEKDIKDGLKTSLNSSDGIWESFNHSQEWANFLRSASVGSKFTVTKKLKKVPTSSEYLAVIYFEGSNSGSSLTVKFTLADAI